MNLCTFNNHLTLIFLINGSIKLPISKRIKIRILKYLLRHEYLLLQLCNLLLILDLNGLPGLNLLRELLCGFLELLPLVPDLCDQILLLAEEHQFDVLELLGRAFGQLCDSVKVVANDLVFVTYYVL